MKIVATVVVVALVGSSAVATATKPPQMAYSEFTSMHIAEQRAFERVAASCQEDIERWCQNKSGEEDPRSVILDTFVHPLLRPSAPIMIQGGGDVLKETTENENDVPVHPAADTSVTRRLRQVTITSPHASFLPFHNKNANACLDAAFRAHRVSANCGNAMLTLDNVRSQLEAYYVHDKALLNQISIFYLFFMLTMLVALFKSHKILRRQMQLRRLILTTVYRKPQLKRQIEVAAGQSIGYVPPLPPRFTVLEKIGKPWILLVLYIVFTAIFVIILDNALPVLCVFAFLSFWLALFSRSKPAVCACCCCGVTTDDVKKGKLTEAQACCNCCAGTGVCSLQCASCCGGGKDCSCAGGGCCCCSGKTSTGGVEGGCCCCCNGKTSPDGIKDGSCCCCSGGDAGGCCCCCSNSSHDKPKVTKRAVLTIGNGSAVYEGVPIQIV